MDWYKKDIFVYPHVLFRLCMLAFGWSKRRLYWSTQNSLVLERIRPRRNKICLETNKGKETNVYTFVWVSQLTSSYQDSNCNTMSFSLVCLLNCSTSLATRSAANTSWANHSTWIFSSSFFFRSHLFHFCMNASDHAPWFTQSNWHMISRRR